MRCIFPLSFRLCCVGLFLFLVHSILGQGTIDLIDLTPKQPSTSPTQTPAMPTPSGQPGRVLIPISPESRNVATPNPSGIPSGGVSSPFSVPVTTPFSVPVGLGNQSSGISVSTSNSDVAPPAQPAQPAAVSDVQGISSTRPPVDKSTSSVLEDMTEDERVERELLTRRQQIESIADPERRETELEQMQQIELRRKDWLARRQMHEEGADLFYFPRLKEQFLKDGWCQLFDGHTPFGWKIQTEGPYGGGKFTFGQDEIRSDPRHPGLVYTQMPFGDVSLRFDYWAEKDSEVFLLVKTPPNPAGLNTSCYTFILNSSHSTRPRGLLFDRHEMTLAELRTMRESWDVPTSQEEGTWHSARVKVEGNNLYFWMDKRAPMTYFVPDTIQSGHIAFLVTKGEVRFQNILWQPAHAALVFDMESLTGEIPWQLLEGGDFHGNDNNSGFHLFSGSVESKEVYDNYVIQMQYFQGNNAGRSSLFIRSLPGQENTGYEISLQNFPTRRDREAVRGVDAGGFPRMMDARYVRAQDQQWTSLTVLAMDRQIQTWVNGVPVCEVTDRRNVRENVPTDKIDRTKDPFLQPGTIRFTVPKDNGEFQFRRLTVSPVSQ